MVSSARATTDERHIASDKQRIINFIIAYLSLLDIPVWMNSLLKKLIDSKKKMIADCYTTYDGEISSSDT